MTNDDDITCLKIISLNIEFDRHLDLIIPFFEREQPDIILLQEVEENSIQRIKDATGMQSIYSIQNSFSYDGKKSKFGLLTLSKPPIVKHYNLYYRGDPNNILHMQLTEPEKTARIILATEIIKDNHSFIFLNTHFTWSADGKPSDMQRHDIVLLLKLLESIPEFILCGDFNAPRGTEIFERIAAKYKDNIPTNVITTIDKKLHRAGDLAIVVDGLFTTSSFSVKDIRVQDSLSDHCAVVAKIGLHHKGSKHN